MNNLIVAVLILSIGLTSLLLAHFQLTYKFFKVLRIYTDTDEKLRNRDKLVERLLQLKSEEVFNKKPTPNEED